MNLFDYILSKKIGGGNVTLISSTDWDNLTDAQKREYGFVGAYDVEVGYERGKLYYGEDMPYLDVPIIPTMTSATTPSGIVTESSSLNTNFAGWKAFNGTSGSISTIQGCWLASDKDSAPWLAYEFEQPETLYAIWFEVMNNSSPITITVFIEGLTSGGTWKNCIKGGQSVLLSFPQAQKTEYSFNLNGNEYVAFRIRGNESWYKGMAASACGFSRIQVYTI